jgi:predicted secreted protein
MMIMDSKKIVFVPHCILNQSVRKSSSESMKEIVKMFAEYEVGIVQLPCPEAGFDPKTDRKFYRRHCRKISSDTLREVKDYLDRDFKVIGILGVELSPTCGVYRIESKSKVVPGKGVLTEELEKGMQKDNFQVPIISVNTSNIFSTLEKINMLLKNS